MTHVNAISCGQGAPSLFLIVMAGEGMFPCDHIVVADTGWERDMLWNTGRRTDAKTFFEEVTKPLAESYGMTVAFSRVRDKNGKEYLPIPEHVLDKQKLASTEEFTSPYYGIDIPVFGSQGGRINQSCTSKWKVSAIRQELRRKGATSVTTYLGLHRTEIHRCKPSDVNWVKHAWPLIDMMESEDGVVGMGIGDTWDREKIYKEMDKREIPYVVSSECDGCPHKNWERWKRTSPETIEELSLFESSFNGEFFLTGKLKPLKEALKEMEEENRLPMIEMIDACDSGYCFV